MVVLVGPYRGRKASKKSSSGIDLTEQHFATSEGSVIWKAIDLKRRR